MDAEVTSGHAYGKAVDLWHLVRGPTPLACCAERCAERPHWMRFRTAACGQLFILVIRTVAHRLTVAQGVILYMLVTGHPPFRDFGTPPLSPFR